MLFFTGFHDFEIIYVRPAELILKEEASIFLLSVCTQLGQRRLGCVCSKIRTEESLPMVVSPDLK